MLKQREKPCTTWWFREMIQFSSDRLGFETSNSPDPLQHSVCYLEKRRHSSYLCKGKMLWFGCAHPTSWTEKLCSLSPASFLISLPSFPSMSYSALSSTYNSTISSKFRGLLEFPIGFLHFHVTFCKIYFKVDPLNFKGWTILHENFSNFQNPRVNFFLILVYISFFHSPSKKD